MQDKLVFDLFPVLIEKGFDEYQKQLKKFEVNDLEGKFVYMNTNVFGKEESCKSVKALRDAKQKSQKKQGLFGLKQD